MADSKPPDLDRLILVVRLHDYAHLVPFVETADGLLLKTIIPSRKATRHYISDP